MRFNPFVLSTPFLYLLKILETVKFSDVLGRVGKGRIENK